MKSISIKYALVGAAALALLFLAFTVHASSITTAILEGPGVTPNLYRHAELFATSTTDTTLYATTTNATSSTYYVPGADRITFYFSRSGTFGANTGTSRFNIQVSPDGSNWYDYSRLHLTDASKTATSTVSISAATSTTMASLDVVDNSIYAVRCVVVEVTDGEHGCAIAVDF
jgi:hypothetical protein